MYFVGSSGRLKQQDISTWKDHREWAEIITRWGKKRDTVKETRVLFRTRFRKDRLQHKIVLIKKESNIEVGLVPEKKKEANFKVVNSSKYQGMLAIWAFI